jgi:plastocyanin
MKYFVYLLILAAIVGLVYWVLPGKSVNAPAEQQITSGKSVVQPGGMDVDAGGKVLVSIKGFAFVSDNLKVSPGTKITWTNFDSVRHSVVGNGFNSGTLNKGQSYSFTFTKPGTYTYYCGFHPDMKGTILVQ